MKICVIGNSHVAAIKNAWDEVSCNHPSHELYFFAAPGSRMSNLELVGECLEAKTEALAKNLAYTSGKQANINIPFFDIFLICGLGLIMPLLDVRLSNAVIKQTCEDVFVKSLACKISKLIRKVSRQPIYLLHNPQIAPLHIKNSKLDNKILYFQIISLINESINILNTALIPQPKETLTALWYSNEKFSIGSQKLLSAELYPQVDGRHMNKDFGILWLANFMNEIDSTAEQLS